MIKNTFKLRINEVKNKKYKEKTIKVLLDFLSSDSERSFVLPNIRMKKIIILAGYGLLPKLIVKKCKLRKISLIFFNSMMKKILNNSHSKKLLLVMF